MGVGISDNDTSADAVTPDSSSSSLSESSTSSEGSGSESNSPKCICSPALAQNAITEAQSTEKDPYFPVRENESTGLNKTGMVLSHPPMLNPGTTIPTPLNPNQDHIGSQEPNPGTPPVTPTPRARYMCNCTIPKSKSRYHWGRFRYPQSNYNLLIL